MWADRNDVIEDFEDSLVEVDTTYELFSIVSSMLRAESSLRIAALPNATDSQIAQAETDRIDARIAIGRADRTLPDLLQQVTADSDDETAVLSLIGNAVGLAEDLLDRQVAGEPVLSEIDVLIRLARESASGLVLPFADATDQEAVYLYEVLGSTVEYYDQFDRDRANLIDSFEDGSFEVAPIIVSDERSAKWRDVTYSRRLIPQLSEGLWLATTVDEALSSVIELTDPLRSILSDANETGSVDLFQSVQALDGRLASDVDLAYGHLQTEVDNRLRQLRTERNLTAITSIIMTVLGIALPWLTISEVRRRRRVEAAHGQAMDQLAEKADRDPSTGAWNRRRLESSVQQMMDTAESDEMVVLAYLDLDHFKAINDVWGHGTGDQVLKIVTQRLSDFVYHGAAFELCRFGGDEFVLFAKLTKRPLMWLEGLGMSVLREVGYEMDIGGRCYEVAASVGVATSNAESTLDSLLLEADSSLLLAKQERGSAVVYNRDVSRTGELVHALPQALSGGEIEAHFQPVVDATTGKILHVEALARWNRPSGELVSPGVFIPLVESYGLAEQLTMTMLASVRDFIRLPTTPDDIRVWINVSPRELDVANFSERFVAMLHQLRLPASRVGIEITETAAVRDPERLAIELRRLHELDLCVAIDDFGSGYSPLGYLRFLPADLLKLDRSLITTIHSDLANQHIVTGVVGLARELGMGIVAEGVEHEADRQWLLEHGVETMQGFLFERPIQQDVFTWDDCSIAKPKLLSS